jgi:tetratricopeptide (TPR) repeat protein
LAAFELARQLEERGRFEEALKIYRGLLKIDYRFETVRALGLAEYRADELESATRHLQDALMVALDDEHETFEVFKTLGNIFVRLGDFDSAEDNYNKAHRLCEDCAALWVNFGTLSIQRQDWDEAISRFRRALELEPRNDRAWVGLAIGHRMKGDLELAWGNIEAAIEYNPLNDVALGLALEWSAGEGREFRALELIRGFLLRGGWSERLSLAFAWLSWRRGDTEAAALELERLLAVNPANEQAYEFHRQLGRP